ncbi:major facilitator superfamily MFS_1 [Rippkaea orientalis PCC 8801]|uniref:Major facilitator superfamily MFS_1 n=1 Tax=Rippkaea orientalis (strain PCC 8801 / RF-1) TaxID=41431 RepID=B7K2U1_RIPO1|nr:MFS transporter [Rippkaea orientalis]ACK67642.1 major facilitator superfamily MFS_1 [Rippkaea orientalis PCC 8801]
MKIFLIIWLGQLVSFFGSHLTDFALGIWVLQKTGAVTEYSFTILATTLPWFIMSPIAGALVDRWDHRWTMILSDSGAGLSTLMIMILATTGHLAVWHVYVANAFSAICNTFQLPAYTAAIPFLVSQEQLSRVSGLRQLSIAVGNLLSPLLAGALFGLIHLQGIVLIDFLTFGIALMTLLCVRFPQTHPTHSQTKSSNLSMNALVEDIKIGFIYISQRPGLLGLFLLAISTNFLTGTVTILFTPLVLSSTSPLVLGGLLMFGGLGMLSGSLLISLRGGPKRYIDMVLGFTALSSLSLIVVGFPFSLSSYALGVLLFFLSITLINIGQEVILQKKVDLSIQGRIFALKQMGITGAITISYTLGGLLADRIFEPFMASEGILANTVGLVIGVGKGRGIGLMFILMGLLTLLLAVIAYRYPRLRWMEDELPDIALH